MGLLRILEHSLEYHVLHHFLGRNDGDRSRSRLGSQTTQGSGSFRALFTKREYFDQRATKND